MKETIKENIVLLMIVILFLAGGFTFAVLTSLEDVDEKGPFKIEKWRYVFICETPHNMNPSVLEKVRISKTRKKYSIDLVRGEIVHVDEDSFPIGYIGPFAGMGSNSHVEFIRIKDDKTFEERDFLIPQPFNYKVRDYIKESYLPLKKAITFEQIADKWNAGLSAYQLGELDNIEGIIIKGQGFWKKRFISILDFVLDKFDAGEEIVFTDSYMHGYTEKYVLLSKNQIK